MASRKRNIPYIALYPSDWLGGVELLETAIEHALYHKICLYIWDKGKPPHESLLRRMLREPENQINEAFESLLQMGKVRRDENGCVTNQRAMDEYDEAQDRHRKNSKKSTHAANVRWAKERRGKGGNDGLPVVSPEDATSMPDAMLEQCQPEPEPEPDIENQEVQSLSETSGENSRAHTKTRQPLVTLDFDLFKTAYPKRYGKQDWPAAMQRATKRIKEGHEFEFLIHKANEYRLLMDATGQEGTKFTMQASSFLGTGNNKPFLDDFTIPDAPHQQGDVLSQAMAANREALSRGRNGTSGVRQPDPECDEAWKREDGDAARSAKPVGLLPESPRG